MGTSQRREPAVAGPPEPMSHSTEGRERPSANNNEEEARARHLAGRRVFVLTPEGCTLQVYTSSKPGEASVRCIGMCHFDGKLMVADVSHEVSALQGL